MTRPIKSRYVFGSVRVIECSCGVWRFPDLPCWNHQDRKQSFGEAVAQLNQAIRNLGYEITKSVRLK